MPVPCDGRAVDPSTGGFSRGYRLPPATARSASENVVGRPLAACGDRLNGRLEGRSPLGMASRLTSVLPGRNPDRNCSIGLGPTDRDGAVPPRGKLPEGPDRGVDSDGRERPWGKSPSLEPGHPLAGDSREMVGARRSLGWAPLMRGAEKLRNDRPALLDRGTSTEGDRFPWPPKPLDRDTPLGPGEPPEWPDGPPPDPRACPGGPFAQTSASGVRIRASAREIPAPMRQTDCWNMTAPLVV